MDHSQAEINDFPQKLLKLALEKRGVPYELSQSPFKMNESRIRKMLENHPESLNVSWFGTSKEFESRLQAIYIPIYQ